MNFVTFKNIFLYNNKSVLQQWRGWSILLYSVGGGTPVNEFDSIRPLHCCQLFLCKQKSCWNRGIKLLAYRVFCSCLATFLWRKGKLYKSRYAIVRFIVLNNINNIFAPSKVYIMSNILSYMSNARYYINIICIKYTYGN